MTIRIITHGGCTDGFCSAFFIKKHYKYFLPEVTKEEIENAEIISLQPRDIQNEGEFEFTENDIVLDLPKPSTKIKLWVDHHSSNKPDNPDENDFWEIAPSNTGLLFKIAISKGLSVNNEHNQFKESIDIIDSASYTQEQIKDNYYEQESYDTPLQKLHLLSSMFQCRDRELNQILFKTLLSEKLGETPLTTKGIWDLRPLLFHQARLINFTKWREHVDAYLELIDKTVVQDDRKVNYSKGVADRFYAYLKFPTASYNLLLKDVDEDMMRIGIGSNIFDKELCKVDIGKLCKEVGKKFGEGSGGGHFYVGGATILRDNGDKAREFILKALQL